MPKFRLHSSPKLIFTREDDEMILANSQGRLSLRKLLRQLHCGEGRATDRAIELNVELMRQKLPRGRAGRPSDRYKERKPIFYPIATHNDAPHVGKDLLLQRLLNEHGDRRYGSAS